MIILINPVHNAVNLFAAILASIPNPIQFLLGVVFVLNFVFFFLHITLKVMD